MQSVCIFALAPNRGQIFLFQSPDGFLVFKNCRMQKKFLSCSEIERLCC